MSVSARSAKRLADGTHCFDFVKTTRSGVSDELGVGAAEAEERKSSRLRVSARRASSRGRVGDGVDEAAVASARVEAGSRRWGGMGISLAGAVASRLSSR